MNSGRGLRALNYVKSNRGFDTRPHRRSRPSRFRVRHPISRAEIADASQRLDSLRQGWLNPTEDTVSLRELKRRTLTNLYNTRPTWLDLAHTRLDEAVFAAYGWPADLSDGEIIARLLALNLEREAV